MDDKKVLREEMEALQAEMERLRKEIADIKAFTRRVEEQTERMIIDHEYQVWILERESLMKSGAKCKPLKIP